MLKQESITHNGHTYTLTAGATDNELQVVVTEGSQKIATYSVTIETAFDAKISGFPTELIDSLMQQAKDDIEAGIIPAKSN